MPNWQQQLPKWHPLHRRTENPMSMNPGTERSIQRLAESLPSQLRELSQAIVSLTEAVKPKDDLVAIDMETEGVKPVVLHLTANEWVELMACVESKIARVSQGEYDDDDTLRDDGFDAKKWEEDLRTLVTKLTEQGESQGIAY